MKKVELFRQYINDISSIILSFISISEKRLQVYPDVLSFLLSIENISRVITSTNNTTASLSIVTKNIDDYINKSEKIRQILVSSLFDQASHILNGKQEIDFKDMLLPDILSLIINEKSLEIGSEVETFQKKTDYLEKLKLGIARLIILKEEKFQILSKASSEIKRFILPKSETNSVYVQYDPEPLPEELPSKSTSGLAWYEKSDQIDNSVNDIAALNQRIKELEKENASLKSRLKQIKNLGQEYLHLQNSKKGN